MPDSDGLISMIVDHQRRLAAHQLWRRVSPVFDIPLTMQQARVLFLVHLSPRATGQALASRLGVSQATISGVVDRLVTHGLLHRVEDPDDRRVRLLRLTPAGDQVVATVQGANEDMQRRLLSLLDHDMLADLDRILAELLRRLERSLAGGEDEPPPGSSGHRGPCPPANGDVRAATG